MINITNEKGCCGCAACSVVCPQNCISMKKGTLGHLFPYVDEKACIKCGKCETVCPMLKTLHIKNMENQRVYAAYAKDKNVRYEGSSGGMFQIFSEKLLLQGYTIFGAAFDEKLQLKCTKAETIEQLKPLMKSKYLQSNLSDKYSEIKKLLNNKKKVLFVSTPCQVIALKKYLGKEYENLITVDFFCHGVPSQDFFDKCKSITEDRRKIEIVSYQFRTKKKNGTTPHYYCMKYKKQGKVKSEVKLYFKSYFYAAFQKYINLRESCYECQFSGKQRYSDITIGDFHDIDNYLSGINRFDGVSTVVINTLAGEKLWEVCKEQVNAIEMSLKQLIQDRVCFGGGTLRPERRNEFLVDYENMSFSKLANKWMNSKDYWKQEIYYSLPKSIRRIIKNFMGEGK